MSQDAAFVEWERANWNSDRLAETCAQLRSQLAELVEACRPLIGDHVSHFSSAWEIEDFRPGMDGVELAARLKELVARFEAT